MKVCLDIQAALGQRAGVGRYVRELLWNLGAEAGADELSAFYFDFKRTGLDAAPPGVALRTCRWMPGRVAQAAWKRLGFPPYDWFAGRADLYHFPEFHPSAAVAREEIRGDDPRRVVPADAGDDGGEEPRVASAEIHRTAERADAILTDSHFSAREICELLKVPRKKCSRCGWGCRNSVRRPRGSGGAGAAALGLEKPYLLMVGTIEPRKNIPFLVKVYEALKDFDGDLVLAGGLGWKTGGNAARHFGIAAQGRDQIAEASGRCAAIGALCGGGGVRVSDALRGVRVSAAGGDGAGRAGDCGAEQLAARSAGRRRRMGGRLRCEVWAEWAQAVRGVLGDGKSARAARLRAAGFALDQAKNFRSPGKMTAKKTWDVYRRTWLLRLVAGGRPVGGI
jgi:hypothetical protein